MKRTRNVIGLALAGLGLVVSARSQEAVPPAFEKSAATPEETDGSAPYDPFDPDIHAPKQVQVQVEFVEMPHEVLTTLLFLAKPKSADATNLRQQVQELVAKKEAKVLETQIVVAKSGQKATTEVIHEFIYPTEFTPMTQQERDKQAQLIKEGSLVPTVCFSPATPTAFETRNVGCTLEIEPTIDASDKLIDLRFVPEILWHTGNTVWHEGKDPAGNPFKQSLPNFFTIRLNTALTCLSGQYTLAAAVSPKDAKGEADMTRKVMIFVKCDILAVR